MSNANILGLGTARPSNIPSFHVPRARLKSKIDQTFELFAYWKTYWKLIILSPLGTSDLDYLSGTRGTAPSRGLSRLVVMIGTYIPSIQTFEAVLMPRGYIFLYRDRNLMINLVCETLTPSGQGCDPTTMKATPVRSGETRGEQKKVKGSTPAAVR